MLFLQFYFAFLAIILNLYRNETETDEYSEELKIDYSYYDEDGYNVTDISSISNIKLLK